MAKRSVDTSCALRKSLTVTHLTQVRLWEQGGNDPWRMWKLIPVRVDDPLTELDGKKDEALPKYTANQ